MSDRAGPTVYEVNVRKDTIQIGELVEQAFLAGYRHGVESYAVWRDGQQLVGCLERPMGEVFRRAPEDCKDAYRMFLNQHRRRDDERRGEVEHD